MGEYCATFIAEEVALALSRSVVVSGAEPSTGYTRVFAPFGTDAIMILRSDEPLLLTPRAPFGYEGVDGRMVGPLRRPTDAVHPASRFDLMRSGIPRLPRSSPDPVRAWIAVDVQGRFQKQVGGH